MLRLRKLGLACALGSAGATTAIALVARLDFAYHSPAAHVGLETTAALTASAAAFLFLGRFRRTGFLDELILSAGLSLLALSSLAFAAVPAIFADESNRVSTWGALVIGAFAALLTCLAALLPRRELASDPHWPLIVYGSTATLAIAGAVPVVVYGRMLPPVVKTFGATRPLLFAHPAVFTLQLVLALLYLLAALGFARRHRITGDELSGWLEVACIFSAAARVNYSFHPSFFSDWVYTGDVFRLGFYLALLIGAAREIASYWRTAVWAASLEERRRLARDVHDGLAQEIAFIGRNLRLLRERGAEADLVDQTLSAVARAREESRRVVSALDARVDLPLEQAVAQAAQLAAERYGVAVEVGLEDGFEVSLNEREAVVRIVSEAVTNAARHSGSDRLRVNLRHRDTGLQLEVLDDGVGFEQERPGRQGFGLVTMKERAEALGGKLHVYSRRGVGTRVELELEQRATSHS